MILLNIIQAIIFVFLVAMVSYLLGSLILMFYLDIKYLIKEKRNEKWKR